MTSLEHLPPKDADSVKALAGLLLETVQNLADAGQIEQACRMAGRACALLRAAHPADAHRFNSLLHRLTPKLDW